MEKAEKEALAVQKRALDEFRRGAPAPAEPRPLIHTEPPLPAVAAPVPPTFGQKLKAVLTHKFRLRS